MNQSERIASARMGVILASPFFGCLLMRLHMERDDSKPTFCTNGRAIKYNEDFAASLSDAELRGVLVHEVAHCAQGHLWRMGQRDPKTWNIATDYAINNFLTAFIAEEAEAARQVGAKYFPPWELPKDALLDPQYANLCSEDIYNRLPKRQGKETGGQGDGENCTGKGQPAPSYGEFEQPADDEGKVQSEGGLEADWTVAVTQAATVAKMRGSLPASIARMIGELLEPKVPWRQVSANSSAGVRGTITHGSDPIGAICIRASCCPRSTVNAWVGLSSAWTRAGALTRKRSPNSPPRSKPRSMSASPRRWKSFTAMPQ